MTSSTTQLIEVQERQDTPGVRIAIEGCGHGTLNNIYSSITAACKAKSWPGVDLLIICGDFEAIRNSYDLHAMAVPAKYRHMGDFHEYYSGARTAPYLTLFIGGNHEASNYLFELYYGGWVAPNIYYMGAANVLRLGPLRIAGMSGIWKGGHYRKQHYERLPYNDDHLRSIYHIRELDVRKLLQIRTQVDIGLSHDWPARIEWCGDWKDLFRRKAHFEADARNGTLGSIAAKEVLERLRPRYWFSAHMHVRFTALVKHNVDHLNPSSSPNQQYPQVVNLHAIDLDIGEDEAVVQQTNDTNTRGDVANSDEIQLDLSDLENDAALPSMSLNNGTHNPDEIQIDEEDDKKPQSDTLNALPAQKADTGISEDLRAQLPDSFKRPVSPKKLAFPQAIRNDCTKFLALDKCLPNRDFLQLSDILLPEQVGESRTRPFRLEYDKEWLAITRVFAKELVLGRNNFPVPRHKGEDVYRKLIEQEEEWVEQHIASQGSMLIPDNFVKVAPVYDPLVGPETRELPKEYANPQSTQFCSMLQIDNPFEMAKEEKARREAESSRIQNELSRFGRGQFGDRGRNSRGGRGNRGGRGRGGYGRGQTHTH
ncbi:MAG: hypothetical protein GOMPHAMPRED_000442 [Gomphillus americanus]|uniref:Lariat debranching enzyme C-terminal domain-containing protein n=1 Tax=Gomphillus americanus TaxID=1940652 RepID=A0A8H3I7U0_9LECA|nr:MAG: hypothetical protein GOMPHAMPRED_000442 [Gomphillus americanus]